MGFYGNLLNYPGLWGQQPQQPQQDQSGNQWQWGRPNFSGIGGGFIDAWRRGRNARPSGRGIDTNPFDNIQQGIAQQLQSRRAMLAPQVWQGTAATPANPSLGEGFRQSPVQGNRRPIQLPRATLPLQMAKNQSGRYL